MNKRELLGPLYGTLVRTRHARPVRIAAALPLLPSQHLRGRRNRPYFAVDIQGVMGMGAVLAHAIRLCRYAASHGLEPRITSTNPLYAFHPGMDCLAPYLGPELRNEVVGPPMRFRHSESLFHLRLPRHLPLREASSLFWATFPPKAVLMAEVDAVLARVPDNRFDLSMHYRATDKALEAKPASFAGVEAAVEDHLAAGGRLEHVFLATDDSRFEARARDRWPTTVFSTYNRGGPVAGGMPRHFSDMPPADKALEALVNMFLLTAAPRCVRTSSYLSALSKVIDPSLRTVTLNRTLGSSQLFPEHEILSEEGVAEPSPNP